MTGTVCIKHERSYTVATHELAVTHQLSQTHVRPLKTCAGLANKHLCLVRASSWVVVEVHLRMGISELTLLRDGWGAVAWV